jgi:hypothetical protein
LFSLFDAFGEAAPGEPVGGASRRPQRSVAPSSSHPCGFRLRDAAGAGRTGETVMLSLLTLGEEGPTTGRSDVAS